MGRTLRTIKVFINNINSYHGSAIAETLLQRRYKLFGTLDPTKSDQRVSNATIILRNEPDYINKITKCDIIVYDIGILSSELDEACRVFEKLKKSCRTIKKSKKFILISTPMTWAKTPKVEDTHEIFEHNYRRRVCHPDYTRHMDLENDVITVQNSFGESLKTVVICPGITYGGENYHFKYAFHAAFDLSSFCYTYEPGFQLVPLVYIKDFGAMVNCVIRMFPQNLNKFIFAIQPDQMPMVRFMCIIHRCIRGSPDEVLISPKNIVQQMAPTFNTDEIYKHLVLDLKMKPLYFKSFRFAYPKNDEQLAQLLSYEFRKAHNINPIKLLIVEPFSAFGKYIPNELSALYLQYYNNTMLAAPSLCGNLYYKIKENKVKHYNYLIALHSAINNLPPETLDAYMQFFYEKFDWGLEYDKENTTRMKFYKKFFKTQFDFQQFDTAKIKEFFNDSLCEPNECFNTGYILTSYDYDYSVTEQLFPRELFSPKNKPLKNVNIAPTHILQIKYNTDKDDDAIKTPDEKSCIKYFHENQLDITMSIDLTESKPDLEKVVEDIKQKIGPPQLYLPPKRDGGRNLLLSKTKFPEINEIMQFISKDPRAMNDNDRTVHYYLKNDMIPNILHTIEMLGHLKPDEPTEKLIEYLFDDKESEVLSLKQNNMKEIISILEIIKKS